MILPLIQDFENNESKKSFDTKPIKVPTHGKLEFLLGKNGRINEELLPIVPRYFKISEEEKQKIQIQDVILVYGHDRFGQPKHNAYLTNIDQNCIKDLTNKGNGHKIYPVKDSVEQTILTHFQEDYGVDAHAQITSWDEIVSKKETNVTNHRLTDVLSDELGKFECTSLLETEYGVICTSTTTVKFINDFLDMANDLLLESRLSLINRNRIRYASMNFATEAKEEKVENTTAEENTNPTNENIPSEATTIDENSTDNTPTM